MVMFLLSFVKGSKSAEGGPNPLADMDPGGPNPLGHRLLPPSLVKILEGSLKILEDLHEDPSADL